MRISIMILKILITMFINLLLHTYFLLLQTHFYFIILNAVCKLLCLILFLFDHTLKHLIKTTETTHSELLGHHT